MNRSGSNERIVLETFSDSPAAEHPVGSTIIGSSYQASGFSIDEIPIIKNEIWPESNTFKMVDVGFVRRLPSRPWVFG